VKRLRILLGKGTVGQTAEKQITGGADLRKGWLAQQTEIPNNIERGGSGLKKKLCGETRRCDDRRDFKSWLQGKKCGNEEGPGERKKKNTSGEKRVVGGRKKTGNPERTGRRPGKA